MDGLKIFEECLIGGEHRKANKTKKDSIVIIGMENNMNEEKKTVTFEEKIEEINESIDREFSDKTISEDDSVFKMIENWGSDTE